MIAERNIMELWLFETCNFRCGYCSLVETGAVRDASQLEPYRDPEYIRQIARFFTVNRPGNRAWTILLTGGEPMLLPNLNAFLSQIGQNGDKIGIYTNGSVPFEKVISIENYINIEYIQLSFHPDWHLGNFERREFFDHARRLNKAGIPTLVRFVAVPKLLYLLPELAQEAAEAGVGFLPTTLFDANYPKSYTSEERSIISSYMSGFSSLIQLDGGLDMRGRKCLAADRLYAARLHQGGDVTPCISVGRPIIGNILEGTLRSTSGLKACYKGDQICSCDVHFQQGIVDGARDDVAYREILSGKTAHLVSEYAIWKSAQNIVTTNEVWVGQGSTAHEEKGLVIKERPTRIA